MTNILSFPDPSGWDGPLVPPDPARPTLSEVWAPPFDGAAVGFVLAALGPAADPASPKPILWVQERLSATEAGRPYGTFSARPAIHVRTSRVSDALAAMEMGLSCPSLCAVVGEIWGPAPRLDFTATKRLALRAEASGIPCWLIRRAAEPALSAARERWRVTALPSMPDPFDPRAPGAPRWRAELFRSRAGRPSIWIAGHDHPEDRLDLVAAVGDRAMVGDADARPGRAAR